MHYLGRADVHNLAKEAFVCLAESCTAAELDEVVTHVGGRATVLLRLRGYLHLQGVTFERRLSMVDGRLKKWPADPAYKMHLAEG